MTFSYGAVSITAVLAGVVDGTDLKNLLRDVCWRVPNQYRHHVHDRGGTDNPNLLVADCKQLHMPLCFAAVECGNLLGIESPVFYELPLGTTN
ncbi:MAG: hypothetical protein GY703_19805 [Gammaproteobacteria bacterium]|nr:hypothetical protein [Gammaproteobacteria bacterium]